MNEWEKECTCFACGKKIITAALCFDCADLKPTQIRHHHTHNSKIKPDLIIGSVWLKKSTKMTAQNETWWEVLNPWACEEYLVVKDVGDAVLYSSGTASHKTYLELKRLFGNLKESSL
jgi:hypothetical protein